MNEFLEAIQFYCKTLGIHPDKVLFDNLENEEEDIGGYCEQILDGESIIYLVSVQTELEEAHQILAHEMIHVWQYETGLLVDLNNCMTRWKGKIYLDPSCYVCPKMYENAPWEKQAFALQNRLYRKYLDWRLE